MTPGNAIRLAQISDPQLGFSDSRERQREAERKGVSVEEIPLRYTQVDRQYYKRAIDRVHDLDPAPDAVYIAGDLVDRADSPRQWADYARTTGTFRVPVYETMGNHDGFTGAGLDHFRNVLGKQDFYSFRMKGVFFLVLNSNFLKAPDAFPEETASQQAFAERALESNGRTGCRMLLMHHPLYFEAPEEAETYFSLPATTRAWVLDLVDRFGIRAVLSGHYHRNHVVRYGAADLITTGPTSEAMGYDHDGAVAQRGFRVLDLNPDTGALDHEFIRLEPSPSEQPGGQRD